MNRPIRQGRAGEQPKPVGFFTATLLLVLLSDPRDLAGLTLTDTH
jgi:hypothetical protein